MNKIKRFIVDVDFTISRRIAVDATSKEHAIEITNRLIKENPYNYLNDTYVCHEITDVVED